MITEANIDQAYLNIRSKAIKVDNERELKKPYDKTELDTSRDNINNTADSSIHGVPNDL